MNWSFIVLQLVVFLGLISFMLALVYYVRHRHQKEVSIKAARQSRDASDGGPFLKRYVPPEHRLSAATPNTQSLFASKPLFYISCMLIPAFFITFIGVSYYNNRSDFLKEIDLSASELQGISDKSHEFLLTTGYYAPRLEHAVQGVDRKKQFVVFKSRKQNDYFADDWMEFLKDKGLRSRICFYHRLRRCKLNSNSIGIVSLANSEQALISHLISKKASVWAYGFPTDINQDTVKLPGLDFSLGNPGDLPELAMIGDRELTLGIDAGLHFPIKRATNPVVARSDNPQAIAMHSDRKAGGDVTVRMHTGTQNDSRFVWMDYPISEVSYLDEEIQKRISPVLANMIKYLTKQEYSSVATWPEGKKYAAFIEQDTEDGYKVSSMVADFFDENDYPVTWFALSNLAQKHRSVSLKLAMVGEMACHGDNHDIFPRYTLSEQTQRLARCVKVIETVTGQRPTGFRPPTEAYNNDTLSAALNAGMTHVFTESWTSTFVPHLKVSRQSGGSLVSMPRAITDDYYLWPTLNLNHDQSIQRMMDELRWIRSSGSLFAFSFHTQFMHDSDRFDVVKSLAHAVNKDPDSWTDTAGNIARWWRVRHKLLLGYHVGPGEYDQFKPVSLLVDKAGKIVRLSTPGADSDNEKKAVLAVQDQE